MILLIRQEGIVAHLGQGKVSLCDESERILKFCVEAHHPHSIESIEECYTPSVETVDGEREEEEEREITMQVVAGQLKWTLLVDLATIERGELVPTCSVFLVPRPGVKESTLDFLCSAIPLDLGRSSWWWVWARRCICGREVLQL